MSRRKQLRLLLYPTVAGSRRFVSNERATGKPRGVPCRPPGPRVQDHSTSLPCAQLHRLRGRRERILQAFHIYHLLLPTAEHRGRFITFLEGHGVNAVFHYVPLNLSPMGESLGARPGDCPVAEDISSRLVRLPFFTGLDEGNQEIVIRAVTEYSCG